MNGWILFFDWFNGRENVIIVFCFNGNLLKDGYNIDVYC